MSSSRLLLRSSFLRPSVTPCTARVTFFSTSHAHLKVVPDPVKDAVKKVDRTVSNAAIKGLEVGEAVTEKTKETLGIPPKNPGAAAEADEFAGEVKGKASEVAGEARGRAEDGAGKVKGTVYEATGKARGAAAEARGKTGI